MWDAEPSSPDWKRFPDWTAKMDTIRLETLAKSMHELQRVSYEARAKETHKASITKPLGKKG